MRSLLLLGLLLGAPARAAEPEVVLLRPRGIAAFTEVTESFYENCRFPVQQLFLSSDAADEAQVLERVRGARLIVALGQRAADLVAAQRAPAVNIMAPDSLQNLDSAAPPEHLFRALRSLRPRAQVVGAVSGPRGLARLERAQRAAASLGLALQARSATDGPSTIRALGELVQSGVDAVWIGADARLLTPPVFQYLLRLQVERGLPVLAMTRQQVYSGALLSVDVPLSQLGRRLAVVVGQVLSGERHEGVAGLPYEITLNRVVARSLGLRGVLQQSPPPGWRFE